MCLWSRWILVASWALFVASSPFYRENTETQSVLKSSAGPHHYYFTVAWLQNRGASFCCTVGTGLHNPAGHTGL